MASAQESKHALEPFAENVPQIVQPGRLHESMDESERLFHYTVAIINRQQDPFILGYELLQRLNLVNIQNDLARYKADIWKDMRASKEQMENLRKCLTNYSRYKIV